MSNRPPVPEGWEFRLSHDRRLFAIYDPGNGPWFVPEPSMRGRFVDSADMNRLGWYRYVPALEDDADSVGLVSDILNRTADLVDGEDLPQTAKDTADFCDGARWATAEVRRLANEVTAEDPGWRPSVLDELAQRIQPGSTAETGEQPIALTPCVHSKALHATEHDGLIVEGCPWCAGREQQGVPGHSRPLVRVTSGGIRPAELSGPERAMLRYALELAEEQMASRGDEFTDEEAAAVESLRRLATTPEDIVAYLNPYQPGVLLCREHGEGWAGMKPLTSDDLPNGGICTHGDPADPDDVCGRDVLA